jgi:hypothetical protein
MNHKGVTDLGRWLSRCTHQHPRAVDGDMTLGVLDHLKDICWACVNDSIDFNAFS